MNKKKYFVFVAFCFCCQLLRAQKKDGFVPNKKLMASIDKSFALATEQYKFLKKHTPDTLFPRTYDAANNKWVTSKSDWWCSGFYPGTLLYLYQQTKDSSLHNEAMLKLKYLTKEQYNKTTHDLGFMMYCGFGNANRLQPTEDYKNILINSAKSLSTRFNATVGCIRSWDSQPSDFLVIIDNMMNLELLFWATKNTGDSSFYKIAVAHANTTLDNHFRSDYSSYHVVDYNPRTGKAQLKRTAQGAADSSAWARGQSWGLYGYTMMYRETKDKKYLQQANNIASFILNNPNLPKDKIPYWDFNAPDIPNTLRDASTAAVIASGLLELSQYVNKPIADKYLQAADQILHGLLSDEYMAKSATNGGFLLKHSVGNKPGKSEVDVPLTYADYYFVEAMSRYKNLSATGKNNRFGIINPLLSK